MLNKLNEDLILYILTNFNFNNCCQNSELVNIKLINKYYKNLIKNYKLMVNYKYYKLSYNFLNKNIICLRCDEFQDEDIKMLNNMCNRYQNFFNYKENSINHFETKILYDIFNMKDNFHEYIHFPTTYLMTEFIKKIKKKGINIDWKQSCCDGKGARFIFI